MKKVVIGSTVYSNGSNNFSLGSAEVTGINVVNDSGKAYTWIHLEGEGEERSITSDVFFKNYTDVIPFFRLGKTYRNPAGGIAVRFEITELLKSDKPHGDSGLYAVAKRHETDGTYSYIMLSEFNFNFMVQV